jgi:hypothetical protein
MCPQKAPSTEGNRLARPFWRASQLRRRVYGKCFDYEGLEGETSTASATVRAVDQSKPVGLQDAFDLAAGVHRPRA